MCVCVCFCNSAIQIVYNAFQRRLSGAGISLANKPRVFALVQVKSLY